MKVKILISVALLSLCFAGALSAFHGVDLICNKCHTMHASEDGVLPTMPDDPTGVPEGPNPHLLYKSSVTELCLVCHDEQTGTPDVFETDVNSLTERAAGFFAVGVGVGNTNPNGHNLARGDDTTGSGDPIEFGCTSCHFGGVFSEAMVTCINCHDPHGRKPGHTYYRYRNLLWNSDPSGTDMITAHVKPNTTGLAVYEQANVGYSTTGSGTLPPGETAWREVTNICLDCHHTYSGYHYTRDGGSEDGICIRHPNTDSEWGTMESINKHAGRTDPAHWITGTGTGFAIGRLPFIVTGATTYAAATTVAEDNEVFCLTCHKAHGSGFSNSIRWDYDASNLGCQQCHNKGS